MNDLQKLATEIYPEMLRFATDDDRNKQINWLYSELGELNYFLSSNLGFIERIGFESRLRETYEKLVLEFLQKEILMDKLLDKICSNKSSFRHEVTRAVHRLADKSKIKINVKKGTVVKIDNL